MSDGEFIFLLGRRFSQYNLIDKIYFVIQHIKEINLLYVDFFIAQEEKRLLRKLFLYFHFKKTEERNFYII